MATLENSCRSRSESGSVLPLVLLGMAGLALLALAGWDTSRFALRAARTQVAATAALHAAESGLDLYVGGTGPVEGPLALDAPPGRAEVTVVELLRLADASRVLSLTAEGSAPRGVPRPVVRRVGLLVRVDTTGARSPVPGSWREIF